MAAVLRARAGGRTLPMSPLDLGEVSIRELEPDVASTPGIEHPQKERRRGAKPEAKRRRRQAKRAQAQAVLPAEPEAPMIVVRRQPRPVAKEQNDET
jgi:hypothetical protein